MLTSPWLVRLETTGVTRVYEDKWHSLKLHSLKNNARTARAEGEARRRRTEPVPRVRPFVPCLSRAPGSPKCLFTGTQSGHGQLCETAVSLPEKAPTHR